MSWAMGTMQAASVLIMILASQVCLVGYCFASLGTLERAAFFLPSLLCGIFMFGRHPVYFALGAACFVAALIWQYITNNEKRRRRRQARWLRT